MVNASRCLALSNCVLFILLVQYVILQSLIQSVTSFMQNYFSIFSKLLLLLLLLLLSLVLLLLLLLLILLLLLFRASSFISTETLFSIQMVGQLYYLTNILVFLIVYKLYHINLSLLIIFCIFSDGMYLSIVFFIKFWIFQYSYILSFISY